jgi:hypothetical protein
MGLGSALSAIKARCPPDGPAVFWFYTLTSRSRQPSVNAEVCRSTPSILNPWSWAEGENSPATPSITFARRAISPLSSAMGRMSISNDLVA